VAPEYHVLTVHVVAVADSVATVRISVVHKTAFPTAMPRLNVGNMRRQVNRDVHSMFVVVNMASVSQDTALLAVSR
jgi:hypothetical protein